MQGDIILINFPFSNNEKSKIRPALIISNNILNEYKDLIILGITSHKLGNQKLEIEINNFDLIEGKLPNVSYIRISKIVSLEKALVIKKVAKLNSEKISETIRKLIELFM